MSIISPKEIEKQLFEKKSFKVVTVGDSITSTEWIHPNWREIVEYVLKEEMTKHIEDWRIPSWGIRFINSGFDGSTSKDLLERVEKEILFHDPDLVINITTTNDILFNIPPENHKQNISELIDKLSEIPKIVITSSLASNRSEHNQEYQPYKKALESIFPNHKAEYIDLNYLFGKLDLSKFFTFKSSGNEAEGIKPGDLDFIHPNQLGNAYIAEILLKEIFDINFDPEKYIQTTNGGLMYPKY